MPEQCWVPFVRTEVVWIATVAALADWLTVRAEPNAIERLAAIVPWKPW